MLRDYLKLDAEDKLVEKGVLRSHNRGQEDVTEWTIINKQGEEKGVVALFDKLSNRRSYRVSYRITQTDLQGKVVVDQLTDVL
ncbi:MAG: hypothetical protein QRY16_09700 [Enterobacterales bacterium endosymbiont of Blomia tropicalis]|uniref:hypothetical protein n=1 Tax=Mixta mediterraneensis TaxID=2758443 RepID=UPI001873B2EB|nr:hypothetical protein [Mixta mediterraneensis]MBE5252861.1 hypothetical protein [Mixta mediterraneensis]MDL4914040.1 hypothetical protein [Mixta mediterraneensis]